MKLAVIGSRDFNDYKTFKIVLRKFMLKYNITEFVSGGARGADKYAEKYAKEFNIPITVLEPEWDKLGKAAGFIRNHQIWEQSDMGLAFWDGISSGTKQSFDIVKAKRKKLIVFNYKEHTVTELDYSTYMEDW